MSLTRKEPLSLSRHWLAAGLPSDWEIGRFRTTRQHDIRYARIPVPEGSERQGTVVVTTGYNEPIDLYVETIQHYQKMGFEVWTMDWFGQGMSGREDPADPGEPTTSGLRPHVGDFHDFVTGIVRHDPAAGPLLLSTHSMGGHISGLLLEQYPDIFDGAVMGAPMFDIFRLNLPQFVRPVIRGIFNVASATGLADVSVPRLTGIKSFFDRASRNAQEMLGGGFHPRRQWQMAQRELLLDALIDNPTFRWIKNSFETTDELMTEENLSRIKIPLLIGTAGRDDLVDNGAHRKVAEFLPNARQVVFPDARHGLWFERDNIYNSWINQIRGFFGEVVASYRQRQSPDYAAPDADMPDTGFLAGNTGNPCQISPQPA